jgi:putative membrane protein
MLVRSRICYLAAVVILSGAALAQNPGGTPGQTTGPQPGMPGTGGTPGATPSTFPGTGPMDTRMDTRISDKAFVKKAVENTATQVELGKLAEEKGSTGAVKEFGKRMVEDHTKASQNLQSVAAKVNVQVPSELPRGSKKTREKLAKLSGPDFDRAYAKLMVNDHKQDVASFTEEASQGQVPEVKEFAAKTLPTLQEHEKMAENLEASVKK